MAKQKVPAVSPSHISREVKTYRWPGERGIVRQIGANVFLPMIAVPIDGKECFILEPEAPACWSLAEAVTWMEARKEEARKATQGPPLYVPPGRGKVQA